MAHVGIIGGGVAGMAAAYQLTKLGHTATLCEAGPRLGGLAGSFDFGGAEIEKFYHFICKPDVDLLAIAQELGLGDDIIWNHSPMGFYYDGAEYPFGGPIDLLLFKPISFISRLRFGFNVIYARSIKYWEQLEGISAKDWLIRHIGEQAYGVIWHPLLRIKFGPYYDQVAASWMWHRIHRVAKSREGFMAKERMGFFRAGSQMLVDKLQARLEEAGVDIRLSKPVQQIAIHDNTVEGLQIGGELLQCDAVISTAALPMLTKMLPEEAGAFRDQVGAINYIGVVCMILKLRHPISNNFWLNVNDPRISFNGIIEYTNLNPRPDLRGTRIAYIPYYLRTSEDRYSMADEDLYAEYCEALRLINPAFDPSWVIDYRVFRDKYAQAICTTDFSRQVPEHRAPIRGLYVCDSTQLYPSDRTISGMIGLGRHVAGLVSSDR